jgi:hypothetical protein
MEAKVDVRKLQILNDRINQTIDALNQVRLSVHGLGHTGMGPQVPFPYWGQQQQGYPQTQGIYPGFGGQQAGFQSGFGGQQAGFQGGFGGQQQGIPGFGLQHSPFQPLGNPYVNPVASPWGVTGGIGTIPYLGGLSHSTPDVIEQKLIEERANDPLRITQTFPFYNM